MVVDPCTHNLHSHPGARIRRWTAGPTGASPGPFTSTRPHCRPAPPTLPIRQLRKVVLPAPLGPMMADTRLCSNLQGSSRVVLQTGLLAESESCRENQGHPPTPTCQSRPPGWCARHAAPGPVPQTQGSAGGARRGKPGRTEPCKQNTSGGCLVRMCRLLPGSLLPPAASTLNPSSPAHPNSLKLQRTCPARRGPAAGAAPSTAGPAPPAAAAARARGGG